MNSLGICVEVLIATDDAKLGEFHVSELSPLAEPIALAFVAEPVEVILRIVSMPRFDISRVPPSDCTRIGVIIISSQFLAGPKDAPLLNEQARQLVIRSVKAGAPVGLIAVTDSPATAVDVRLPAGIDWIVATKDANLSAALREGIEKVAFRLWYKAPPPPRNFGGTTADAIVLDYVRSAAELDQSFKLRYQVYDLLGYLEESIRCSASQIDVDAFDRDAIHLIARRKPLKRGQLKTACLRHAATEFATRGSSRADFRQGWDGLSCDRRRH